MRERCWLTLKMPCPEAAWRCAARECEAFRWAFLALPCCLSKKGLGVPQSGQLFGLSAVTAVGCFADEAFMLPSAAPPGQAFLITRYPAEQCRQKSHLNPGRWRPHQRLSRRNAQSRRHKRRKLGLSALPSVFRKPRLLLETLPVTPVSWDTYAAPAPPAHAPLLVQDQKPLHNMPMWPPGHIQSTLLPSRYPMQHPQQVLVLSNFLQEASHRAL